MSGDLEDLDLLIVGAGPTGLLCSMLASELGLRHRVVERRPGLHTEPSAHVVKTHSMEVYRRLGLDARIHALGTPAAGQRYVTWCRSAAGPAYGRIDLLGKKGPVPRFLDFSPTSPANLPQTRLEPILLARAREMAGADPVMFGCEAVGLEQDDNGVTASLHATGGHAVRRARARYLIAADGAGSAMRKAAGIDMEGPPALARFLAIHIRCDFRPLIESHPGILLFVIAPEVQGTFIVYEPDGSQVFMTPIDAERPLADFSIAQCESMVRSALGCDHPFAVAGIGQWVMSAQVARQYRRGRVFLAGDAAHRFPPTGGLGMNTGIEDAENLLWKVAAVLHGQAGDALLDSYELECRPTARRNCDQSMHNASGKRDIELLVGMHDPARSFAQSLDELLGPDGQARRASVDARIQAQIEHFALLGVEMAAAHRQGAFVPAAQPLPLPVAALEGFQPSLTPGAAVPHVWVQPGRSTVDCLGFDRFTLFVGTGQGTGWWRAAAALDGAVPTLEVIEMPDDADNGNGVSWRGYCGGDPFAVLVRPDGRVAWVDAQREGPDAVHLARALAVVLARAG